MSEFTPDAMEICFVRREILKNSRALGHWRTNVEVRRNWFIGAEWKHASLGQTETKTDYSFRNDKVMCLDIRTSLISSKAVWSKFARIQGKSSSTTFLSQCFKKKKKDTRKTESLKIDSSKVMRITNNQNSCRHFINCLIRYSNFDKLQSLGHFWRRVLESWTF